MKNRKSWPRIPPLHPAQNNHWWNYQQNSSIFYDEPFEISHFGEAAGKPCCSLTVWEKACPPYEFPCTSQRGFWKHLAARESYQIWPLCGLSLHSLLVILLFTFKKYNKNSLHLCWKTPGPHFCTYFDFGYFRIYVQNVSFPTWCLVVFISGEGRGNPLQYSCWRIPWTEEPGKVQAHGVAKSWTRLSKVHFFIWQNTIL